MPGTEFESGENQEVSAGDKAYAEDVELANSPSQQRVVRGMVDATMEDQNLTLEGVIQVAIDAGATNVCVVALERTNLSVQEKRTKLAQAYDSLAKKVDRPNSTRELIEKHLGMEIPTEAAMYREKAKILRGE